VKAFYQANKKGYCELCRDEAVRETKREYREPKRPLNLEWLWSGGNKGLKRRDEAMRGAE